MLRGAAEDTGTLAGGGGRSEDTGHLLAVRLGSASCHRGLGT